MTAGIRIERLRAQHDRSGFSCGVPALDRYFREQAGQDARRGVANCFLALDDQDGTILGYYTLAATGVPIAHVPEELKKKLPHYAHLPAALIGRLAVDDRQKGKGVASVMIFDAAMRSIKSDPAVHALVVDAKDRVAADFYRHKSFIPFEAEPMRLFLPLATIRKAQLP